jgi:hypothetical protein
MIAVAMLIGSCGAASGPKSSLTGTPTSAPTFTPTPTVTPVPSSTAAASTNELSALAAQVYPPCTPATCAGSARFTTCDAGASGADVFSSCPLTPRLATQLQADTAGAVSAPDPLGGGQDPEWTTETFAAAPSNTGGVVHVSLGFGPGTNPEKLDLVVLLTGSQLLVDDIYCTGSDPASGDAFADGWLTRSVCST